MLSYFLLGRESVGLFAGDEFLLQGEDELIIYVTDELIHQDIGIGIEFKIEIHLTFSRPVRLGDVLTEVFL